MSDQMMKVVNGWFTTTFAVRLSGDVDIAAAVQKAVSDADPEMPIAKLDADAGSDRRRRERRDSLAGWPAALQALRCC